MLRSERRGVEVHLSQESAAFSYNNPDRYLLILYLCLYGPCYYY